MDDAKETWTLEDIDKKLEREITQVSTKIAYIDEKMQVLVKQLTSNEDRQRTIFELLTTQVWDVETESSELEQSWESLHIEDICNKLNLFHLKSCRLEETRQLLVDILSLLKQLTYLLQ